MAAALILFAHGARESAWAEPLQRVRSAILAQDPGLRVELAFLEFMSPALPECAARLAGEGYGRIVVLPMFIAQGGHLKRDLPEIVATLRTAHPEVRFELAGPVGESEAVIRAMAGVALELLT